MAAEQLLKPTLHVEVQLKIASGSDQLSEEICSSVRTKLIDDHLTLQVGQNVYSFDGMKHEEYVKCVEVVDYTGVANASVLHALADVDLDVKSYMLRPECQPGHLSRAKQLNEDQMPHVRMLYLPSQSLHEDWTILVFEDALPGRLLRQLVRTIDLMSQPGLNLSVFNWNRVCLLYGPPGGGKSTLCRALAQKLSIQLGNSFGKAVLIEINTNSMLSKYFSESGKQIGSTFDHICRVCQDREKLVCVVMDEVETIAGARERAVEGAECGDGLRATNQLLTAFDRIRDLPNVIVLCTSNLIEAIDSAILNRVDIKQFVPSSSASAIYNIFRSCLNELVDKNVIKSETAQSQSSVVEGSSNITMPNQVMSSSSPHEPNTRAMVQAAVKESTGAPSSQSSKSSPEPWSLVDTDQRDTVPTFAEMKVRLCISPDPTSVGERVWALAQQCQGFSGRDLRRLPVLGWTGHTRDGQRSLADAISGLEKAVEQELAVNEGKGQDVKMETV